MNYLEFLSFQFLDDVMKLPEDVKAKYKAALALVTDTGMRPERAFQESGFTEAWEIQKRKEVRKDGNGRHG
jgi:hypothetical protein